MRCRALLLGAAVLAAVPQPAAGEDFPIRTRLTGGPPTYHPGGKPHRFDVELRNTTRTARRDVHPVIVLVDRERALGPHRLRLEYADPATGHWRAVAVEHTDNDENVGVVGGEHGPGATIPAGRSLTVRLRLRFAKGTAPGHVAASATVVQRKGTDGEWVGESAPYEFKITPSATRSATPSAAAPSATPHSTLPAKPPAQAAGPSAVPDSPEGPDGPTSPASSATPATPATPATTASLAPVAGGELAATGRAGRAALAALAMVAVGAALVMAARRRD